MQFKHLLAKSSKNPDNPKREETLVGHTEAVVRAFITLFGSGNGSSRLAQRLLRFFKLGNSDFSGFYHNGLLSCLLHDIGKANSGFQQVVRKKGAQLVRHEHLSGLLLWFPEMQGWLDRIPDVDKRIILSSVICHHLKTAPRNRDFAEHLSGSYNNWFDVYADGITGLVQEFSVEFNLPAPPTLESCPFVWSFEKPKCLDIREDAKNVLSTFRKALRNDGTRHRLLMAVRVGLILADSAGSGLLREGKTIESWLSDAFDKTDLLNGMAINEKIVRPRIREIEETGGVKFSWQGFQQAADGLPDRALLLSACGSGKTLAAWRWIKARLDERSTARVIFLYPTRATASEGFRDYVSWAPEGILLHSSSTFDLEGMFENEKDERHGRDFSVEDRLFALAYWHRRIFSATVHQFLGFMQYAYRSVCLLPLLVDSVVVIDEVHCFDRALFSALKQFLKNFDVPVLCMTATLPPHRRKDLEGECGLEVFPENLRQFEDLQKKTERARYHVKWLAGGEDEALTVALEAKERGQRVLWVVNTVDRCQSLARKIGALCYHSRFKLIDRKARHDDVVKAFKSKNGAVLAVTTQVCEMSLDLDAGVLITELAPITSLIQRMGRCNRHLNIELGSVYFYSSEDEKPYTKDDLKGVNEFLSALDGKNASQSDLDELLETYAIDVKEVEKYAAFLRSGPWAESREADLVDYTDFTVQAVLDQDIREYFELRKEKRPTDGLLLPVPKYPQSLTRQNASLGNYPLIASAAHYVPEFGFFKYPLEVII